ncbi:MAG: hypothetical protein CUN56_02490 [Phototrophicales bacterium]|nr:MAG: hypothetical protein CUN56_02490 [Phototrophicales bacterium]RMG73167.1 MAG: hypothetical protein D6711_11465 [Chloroflexota bacterium]
MTRKTTLIFITLFVLLLGLGFDLYNRGAVWHLAWSVSGEEEPIAQLRGVVEWAGNLIRPQPRTRPLVPIQYTGYNPFGINTFLQLESDPAKIEAQIQMIADAGFTWIRQQFEWAEIEVDGPALYIDSRNDTNKDGLLQRGDRTSGWQKYDLIVALAEEYGLEIQARLDNPPLWVHARNPEIGAFAPPDDIQQFVDFAVAVATRYRGRIRFYQVWNEPNIYPEWGNQPVNPEGYTELLCATYHALKQVDPNIVVISGALAPTQALTGRDLNDFIFLQRMYQAGAGDCFDILSVQGYGLNSGPTDRRMRPTVVNVGRNQYIRDLMVANGDAHKPIWISEAAWNFVPPAAEAPDIAEPRNMFGQVTPQQAADYMPQLYQRAFEEWSWVGVINYWFFTRPTDEERHQPFYYFRMVEPYYTPQNELPFQPLPIYDAMRDYIASVVPTLYRGVHQINDHWAIQTDGIAVTSPDAEFGDAMQVTQAQFVAHGTDLFIRWQGDTLTVQVDDQIHTFTQATNWQDAIVTLSLSAAPHNIIIYGENLLVDSITVDDRTFQHLYPYVVIVMVGMLMLIVCVGGWVK